MFETALPVAAGAVGVVSLRLLYLGATKGLPAAKAKLSSWWNAAKNDAAKLKGDLAGLETRVDAIEVHVGLKKAAPAPAAAVAPGAPIPPVAAPAQS